MDSNHRCLEVGQESLPPDHGTIAVAEVGLEPTNPHQALDLAALPICVLGHQLRRPDSNRRQTAHETVLEAKLQSTPQ